VLRRAFPDDPGLDPAVVVVRRVGGLSDADRAYVGRLASFLRSSEAAGHVQAVQSAVSAPELASVLRSADGRAELVVLTLRAGPLTEGSKRAVSFLRRHLAATAPAGLEHHVTGLSALFADQAQVLTDGLDRTLLATVVLVLVILVLVYRSVVAPLLSLSAIGVAFLVARGLVAALAQRGVEVASLGETWMVMMVFGAGTDYCLFVMSRYREELSVGDGRPAALRRAGRAVGPVITASGVTVVRSVATVLAAGLTLTPALLRLAGRFAFWPSRPGGAAVAPPGRWVRMGERVEARPALMLLGGLLVLLVPSAALFSLRQSFDLSLSGIVCKRASLDSCL
jgi:RND superfamily putative drug exporter